MNSNLIAITNRISERSRARREEYLESCEQMRLTGPTRAHLSCGNQAHAYAASGQDKQALAKSNAGNLGIVTAYNDMLSAHQPFAVFPEVMKKAARRVGGTAQVAGGVPAMCDGITQGQVGMELSLFSRDTIALSAAVALSHNSYDAAAFLGICDKIVPGLVIAAANFGHLSAIFVPGGPMSSGLPNEEKSRIRQEYAAGKIGRDELMQAEMASYHGPGTCTFYGTANSNQMLMEIMGLQLPGSSFVHPHTPLREALTNHAVAVALANSALGDNYRPVSQILSPKAFVNAIVGLMATGGSTNLLIHLIAMGRASGVVLESQDFSDISREVPLLARVYPNGFADINLFHAAGGVPYVISQLLDSGLLHEDVVTVAGDGLSCYRREPKLDGDELIWVDAARTSGDTKVLSSVKTPFSKAGGLVSISGNLGQAVMKVSAVEPEHQVITAPVRIFHDQAAVQTAFKEGQLEGDMVLVVRYQGPRANGMPELHGLTPILTVLQRAGAKVALLTDGRMSGASGRVPAAIHLTPEALDNGPIAYLRDGDIVTIDATSSSLKVHNDDIAQREITHPDLSSNGSTYGRKLFKLFRDNVAGADVGASIFD